MQHNRAVWSLLWTSGLIAVLSVNSVIAAPLILNAVADAGACGGGCIVEDNKMLNPAPIGGNLSAASTSTLTDGSYANASAQVSFGSAHVYADAHRTAAGPSSAPIGDAQAKGFAEFYEYISAATLANSNYNFNATFAITGSHTATDGIAGMSAWSYLYYSVTDLTTSSYLAYGNWTSTDAVPVATIIKNIIVPTGHDIYFRVDFEADAYVMSNNDPSHLTAFADYSKTLNLYLDGVTPGADIIGASGHDYATPLSTTPIPAALPLFASGLGAFGLLGWRRKRKAAAIAA